MGSTNSTQTIEATEATNVDGSEAQRREERHHIVDNIIITYPRYKSILEEVDYMFRRAQSSREPLGLFLTGLMGTGKTTITDTILALHPPNRVAGVMKRPVVRATVPSRATDRSVASALLRAFGDPRWDKGTLTNMTFRLIECVKKAETRIVIIDEVQHFMDQNSNKIVVDAANWFKTIIKDEDVHIGCIMVGLHHEANLLLDANGGQLGSFFGSTRTLEPLAWDNEDDLSKNEFYRFMTELDRLLPFDGEIGLVDADVAWRCHVASAGMLRPLMRLVRRAAHTAIDHRIATVNQDLLAEAFDLMDHSDRRDIPNPFDGDRPEAAPIPEEPIPSSGTNNRSGKRRGRPRKEKKHVLSVL